MDNSRPYVPAFLKNIDRKLLLNNPSVWSARTHLVLYFSVLFAVPLTLLCILFYTDARQNNDIEILIGFVIIIAIVGFIFWLIYLLRFNVFKRFGNWEPWDGLRTFLLYFISVLVIVALPFIPISVETFTANRQFSDAELVQDVNELNINANLLEHDRLPKQWTVDTFNIFKQTYEVVTPGDTIFNTTIPAVAEYQPHKFNITDKELTSRIEYADSTLKINDSTYFIFTLPNYVYVSPYNLDDETAIKKLGKKEMYNAVIKNYTKPDVTKLTARMKELKNKYASAGNDYYNGYDDGNNSFETYISKKYSLYAINNTIERVAQKKYRWHNDWSFIVHFMYYATLILSLLVFIFRHSTKKTFFLSVLVAVILVIITSLFIVMLGSNLKSFFILMILYFITFAVIGFSVSAAKTRTVFQGIGLNFFLFALPIMPFLLTSFYFESIIKNEYEIDVYRSKMQYYIYAELIGFILLLILIEPLFKKLYRNWYSLPQE